MNCDVYTQPRDARGRFLPKVKRCLALERSLIFLAGGAVASAIFMMAIFF